MQTEADHTRTRSWTKEPHDFNLKFRTLNFTMRDLGGDELSRVHWPGALKESFCSLFILSLSDYDKMDKKDPSKCKFSVLRKLLWENVVNNPSGKGRVILILNKQVRVLVLLIVLADTYSLILFSTLGVGPFPAERGEPASTHGKSGAQQHRSKES
jgi:hypothetical protein